MMLPITAGFRDTLRAPNGAATVAIGAPGEYPPAGNNDANFRTAEVDMVGNIQELRIDAVERNAEFTAQLEDVRRQRDNAWAHLTEHIIPARKQGEADIRAHVEARLGAAWQDLSTAISATFDRHNASLLPLDARCDSVSAREQLFMFTETEDIHERQAGRYIRQMQEDRESFALDVVAARAAEAKLEARIGRYEVAMSERGQAEASDRARQAAYLDKQFRDSMDSILFSADRMQKEVTAQLADVKARLAAETAARQAADTSLAHTAAGAMERLRKDALAFFGGNEDEEEEEEDEQ